MKTALGGGLRVRAWLATLLTALLVASGLSLTAMPASAADARTVTTGTVSWGYKQSFRTYVGMQPGAGAEITPQGERIVPSNGAAFDLASSPSFPSISETRPYVFPVGSGTVADTNNLTIPSTGTVTYNFPAHCFVIAIANPTVVVAAGAASIRADLSITLNNTGSLCAEYAPGTTSVSDVRLATGTPAVTVVDDVVSVSLTAVTLSAEGAAAMQGFAFEGDALDDLTLSAQLEAVVEPEVPATPTITVSKTENISPAGEIVTVTGTGFGPNAPETNAGARPPLAGKFGGAYVAFGKYAEVWQPTTGAPTSARSNGDTKWVVNPEDVETVGGTAGGAVAINPDGSFTTQLLIEPGFTGELMSGNYGVYTYAGGGAKYAPFETYTPITFTTAPTISVSKTTDISPLGETVTVHGWNFGSNAPATNAVTPPLAAAGKFGGAYVVFGKFETAWKPSEGIASSARKIGSQKWVVNAEDLNMIGGVAGGGVAINADGSFTTELLVTPTVAGAAIGSNFGIYTYGGGSSKYAPFETYTPITFTTATGTTLAVTANPTTLVEGGSTVLAATVSPIAPGTVTFHEGASVLATVPVDANGKAVTTLANLGTGVRQYTADFAPGDPLLFASSTGSVAVTVSAKTVGAGSLTWGIKESFRSYVTGSIARGTITTTGVGTSGGAFVFGQSEGGSFSESTGVGTSNYSGSVTFAGHSGVLNVRVSNPTVRIDSASSGALLVNVNGRTIEMATLSLAAGSRTTPNNTVTYSGVPATLTAAGEEVFAYNGSSFYEAGDALDPVSFVIGAPSSGGSGGTTTLAAFTGARQPAATPPATTGIVLDAASLKGLNAGGEITATASGFEPNEKDILVVVYSEPTVLARDLAADAQGNVTWTGRLPSTLTGSHTLTFQGSVNRGVVLDIAANVRTASAGCEVTDASLSWGFKESFRSYISGSIANGEWTVSDGATYETPLFGWSVGTGSYDAETAEGLLAFTGAITFTGHGGILNTTVSNPQVRFIDKDTAVILLDVTGTTQDGSAVAASGVEFVELDLAKASVEEQDGVYTITGAPATMLAAGAEAFGTYTAGEAFDAVDLEYTMDPACAVVAEPEMTAMAIDGETEAPADSSWIGWLLGGIAVLALIALAVVLVIRRRSAEATSGE